MINALASMNLFNRQGVRPESMINLCTNFTRN